MKEVEVDVPTSGKKYYFPCNRWLARDKEDGKVVRLLTGSDSQLVTYKPREFLLLYVVISGLTHAILIKPLTFIEMFHRCTI